MGKVNKEARKTIDNYAPSIRVKIYDFESKRLDSVVTQGWQIGCMAVIPDSDFYCANWEIIHQPSGYRMMSSRFDHPCLLKVKIGSKNWRGLQYTESLRDPVMARIVAAWLSGFEWGNPATGQSFTKQSLQKAKDTILSEIGIHFA